MKKSFKSKHKSILKKEIKDSPIITNNKLSSLDTDDNNSPLSQHKGEIFNNKFSEIRYDNFGN